MKLKKLELVGFKSFADKSFFDFEGDFTGLVGPNGSGKSNVVDALKWVLGEQSAKSLRGNEMADMIFNGSDSRRAQSSAEVKVTLDNSSGLLPVDYEEVCISRRCFRSGESKYSLNGKNCRLKEIKNLLLDTGFGVNAYSIIEQGQIDMLLQAGSKERRAVLEEAAGINRFLEQKKQAERKLERVKGNLQRVTDIIEELDRQLRSVRRQASKARRYRRYKDRQIRLRLAHAFFEKAELMAKKRLLAAKLETEIENEKCLNKQTVALKANTGNLQNQVETHRSELAAIDEKISHLDARIYSLNKEVDLNLRRKKELQQRTADLQERYQRLNDNDGDYRSELQIAESEFESGAEKLQQLREKIKYVKNELTEAVNRYNTARDKGDNGKNAAFQLMQQQAQAENQVKLLQSQVTTVANRLLRSNEREAALNDKCSKLGKNIELARSDAQKAKDDYADIDQKAKEVSDSISENNSQLNSLNSKISDLRAELHGKKERKQLIQDLQKRAEGVGAGVKLMLEKVNAADGILAGCPGMLGNLISVSTKYAAAVEAALCRYAQAVIVNTTEQAEYALKLAEKGDKGRVNVIPLDRLPENERNVRPDEGDSLTPLAALIDCPDNIRGVIKALLGNCFVTESNEQLSEHAELAAAASERNMRIVTLDGRLYDANGVWAAGEPEAGGVISRHSELAELNERINTLDADMAELKRKAGHCSRNILELKTKAKKLSFDKDKYRKKEQEASQNVSVLESQKSQTCEEVASLQEDAAALATEKKQALQKIEEKKVNVAELAEKKKKAEIEHQNTLEEIGRLREKRNAVNEQHSRLDKDLSRFQEQQRSKDALIKRLKLQIKQNADEIQRVEKERSECSVEIEKTTAAIQKAHADIKNLKGELHTLKSKSASKKGTIQSLANELKNSRKRSEILEKQLQEAQKKLQKTEIEVNENRLKTETLCDKIADECGINLDALELLPEEWRDTPLYIDAEIEDYYVKPKMLSPSERVAGWFVEECKKDIDNAKDDEGKPRLVGLAEAVSLQKDVFEIVQSPDTDWQEIKKEAAELKNKLERMGGANLDAIKEQDELEIRAEFLTNQREDLEKARRHELELIRRLSKESRTKFIKTFEEVRQNFQVIIRKLFGGGSGDLTLDNETDDVLEAGIDISVRPPGKENRSISLLSGGEKALSAVALLFAIFESKPSPFCLLDEVDAPLDDANVGRFMSLVEQYTENTQFVIVTHNKLTMSAAQTLYGITMHQDGTSRKVAVNFEEVDQQLEEMETETAKAKAG